jgi:hypothetical protein
MIIQAEGMYFFPNFADICTNGSLLRRQVLWFFRGKSRKTTMIRRVFGVCGVKNRPTGEFWGFT